MIQEIGGVKVRRGESFEATYIIGFFNSIDEMEKVYDEFKGISCLEIAEGRLHYLNLSGAGLKCGEVHPGEA